MDIQQASLHWDLRGISLIADTHGSLVYRASLPDGTPIVAKLLKPRGMDEMRGMDYLGWRRGLGAVNLIARQDNACLLEDAGTQTLEEFQAAKGEDAANLVIAEVLDALHSPSPHSPPRTLLPLAEHFRPLAARPAPAHPDHADNLRWAAATVEALLGGQIAVKPLHGDLHHQNIISADGKIWRAIDPHGLIGDPAYDAANFFGNPLGRTDITCDPARIDRLASSAAVPIHCNRRKILEYAAAHAALSACWSIDDPVSDDDMQDALDRLAFLAVVRRLIAE